jgi:hypothetical protein
MSNDNNNDEYSDIGELYACNEIDKKEQECNYYLQFKDHTDIVYTNNPIKAIHARLPTEMQIVTSNFNSNYLALYINCLVAEGYDVFYDVDKYGNDIWGHTVYLRITDEQKEKTKQELEKKTMRFRK